ncbi:MAG: glutaredoxin family protein [Deltaproteobacteria bacterium]|nr:glutaredoxin family protein [Deltaproteobacteria bacterium]
MIRVEIYSKKGCCLCKKAKELIHKVNAEVPFSFKEVDITASEDLFRKYKEDIPLVFINGKKAFKFKVDEVEFRKKIRRELIKSSLSRVWSKKEHFS